MGTIAREYLRVSKGKGGHARSITDQHDDNLEAETKFGPWTWGDPYKDTESASKYARRDRSDFERLVKDMRSKEFGNPGDVLVLWETSRLSRETGRGVELVDLCEEGGYMIHVTSNERTYNPANYNDRDSLLMGIVGSDTEARRLSARTLRGTNSAMREGRPHGHCPFGYRRDYELVDGRPRPVRQYEDPEEGPLVRELFEKVAAGKSIYSIAKEWKTRGVTSRNGVTFSPQNLRTILLRPAYAGLRVHKGTTRPASWSAIVNPKLFDQVQALLSDPSRRTYTSEGIKHELTMTMKCDECGGPLIVRVRRKAEGYECQPHGCVRVKKDEMDAFLIGDAEEPGVILSYLARPDVYDVFASGGDDDEHQGVRAELVKARANLKELEDAEPESLTEARTIARAIDKAETEVRRLEQKLRALSRPNRLAEMFPPGPDVAGRWKALPVAQRRAVAVLLLSPDALGEVRVMPSPVRYHPTPVQERVKFARNG